MPSSPHLRTSVLIAARYKLHSVLTTMLVVHQTLATVHLYVQATGK